MALEIAFLEPRVYVFVRGPAWLPLQVWYPNLLLDESYSAWEWGEAALGWLRDSRWVSPMPPPTVLPRGLDWLCKAVPRRVLPLL